MVSYCLYQIRKFSLNIKDTCLINRFQTDPACCQFYQCCILNCSNIIDSFYSEPTSSSVTWTAAAMAIRRAQLMSCNFNKWEQLMWKKMSGGNSWCPKSFKQARLAIVNRSSSVVFVKMYCNCKCFYKGPLKQQAVPMYVYAKSQLEWLSSIQGCHEH